MIRRLDNSSLNCFLWSELDQTRQVHSVVMILEFDCLVKQLQLPFLLANTTIFFQVVLAYPTLYYRFEINFKIDILQIL